MLKHFLFFTAHYVTLRIDVVLTPNLGILSQRIVQNCQHPIQPDHLPINSLQRLQYVDGSELETKGACG